LTVSIGPNTRFELLELHRVLLRFGNIFVTLIWASTTNLLLSIEPTEIAYLERKWDPDRTATHRMVVDRQLSDR